MKTPSWVAAAGAVLLALADAILASLVVLAAGMVATLLWYVAVEGAPSPSSIASAWRADAPIALGLFLLPAVTLLAACIAGVARLVVASWTALRGGAPLLWVPRVRLLARGWFV
ncbi:hypothetical protein [Roseiterribacter gracilis]|uniref:Uncharacterized protein n=1 Tax=Roseiterribacter gracilis TaxID=2812848 RepID=A0A8S8XFP1_9PROT|nr:hypothetical protein TMPK1_36710 [Rhodospirillales bacterium TMPK1]